MSADQPIERQRRGTSISMSSDELDEFLATERTCRVATVGAGGQPHVTPLWFVWDRPALWLYSLVRSQRFTDLQHNARIAVVVDTGTDYSELRGVEIQGTSRVVGEVPRTGEHLAELEEPERRFADKYSGGTMFHDSRHAWIRVEPLKIASWDFRKIPRDR